VVFDPPIVYCGVALGPGDGVKISMAFWVVLLT
jgi:hypothetical protein